MRRFRQTFILIAGLLAAGSLSACCGPWGCGGHGWHNGGGGGGWHNGGGGYGGGGGWNHPGPGGNHP